jgi:hypothetical protein
MASDALGGFLVDESVNAIHFDPDAQELFNEWLRQHEVELANQDLHNAVESHLSKYAATMPALALVFHVLDYATFVLAGKDDKELRGESSGSVLPDNVPGPWPVSATATHLAAQWIDFLKLHMHALYGTVLNAEVEIAHALLEKMRTGKIRSGMKVRQIYRHGWDKLSTKEAVERGLEVLEDHQWIRLRPEEKAPTGRPASRSFDINPALISKRKSS